MHPAQNWDNKCLLCYKSEQPVKKRESPKKREKKENEDEEDEEEWKDEEWVEKTYKRIKK